MKQKRGETTIVMTQAEVSALADYAYGESRARTFRVVRDARNVLHVENPDGRRYRLSAPETETRR